MSEIDLGLEPHSLDSVSSFVLPTIHPGPFLHLPRFPYSLAPCPAKYHGTAVKSFLLHPVVARSFLGPHILQRGSLSKRIS